jgi:DNA-binding beta-propeller fold protein YncE
VRAVALVAALFAAAGAAAIPLPGGEHGVGFDDLQLAPASKRVLVPAGGTGTLFLLDPVTRAVAAVPGFSAGTFHGGHDQGTTSAAAVAAPPVRLVATDRETRTLRVVDPAALKIIGSVDLAGKPDYVRVVPSTGEVWVTEPSRKQIEVLRFQDLAAGRMQRAALVPVPDGPESLVIDEGRGRAYTHAWTDRTFALDLRAKKVVATWRNGCRQARGIALDAARGLLFSGCAEGQATVVNLAGAHVVSTAPAGPDIDSIGYAAALGHLYVPAGCNGRLFTFRVAPDGKLTLLRSTATALDAHTAAFDPATRTVFVGAPGRGDVLPIPDAD